MSSAEMNRMRAKVKAAYGGPRWKQHVDHMPDEQVYAIYMRFKSKQFILPHMSQKDIKPKEPTHSVYVCRTCWAVFLRDNPDLTECEICGSKNITKELSL